MIRHLSLRSSAINATCSATSPTSALFSEASAICSASFEPTPNCTTRCSLGSRPAISALRPWRITSIRSRTTSPSSRSNGSGCMRLRSSLTSSTEAASETSERGIPRLRSRCSEDSEEFCRQSAKRLPILQERGGLRRPASRRPGVSHFAPPHPLAGGTTRILLAGNPAHGRRSHKTDQRSKFLCRRPCVCRISSPAEMRSIFCQSRARIRWHSRISEPATRRHPFDDFRQRAALTRLKHQIKAFLIHARLVKRRNRLTCPRITSQPMKLANLIMPDLAKILVRCAGNFRPKLDQQRITVRIETGVHARLPPLCGPAAAGFDPQFGMRLRTNHGGAAFCRPFSTNRPDLGYYVKHRRINGPRSFRTFRGQLHTLRPWTARRCSRGRHRRCGQGQPVAHASGKIHRRPRNPPLKCPAL